MELHVCVCCLCRLAQDPCPVGCRLLTGSGLLVVVVVLMTLFTYVPVCPCHCSLLIASNSMKKTKKLNMCVGIGSSNVQWELATRPNQS